MTGWNDDSAYGEHCTFGVLSGYTNSFASSQSYQTSSRKIEFSSATRCQKQQ